jgi:hypothetical protein
MAYAQTFTVMSLPRNRQTSDIKKTKFVYHLFLPFNIKKTKYHLFLPFMPFDSISNTWNRLCTWTTNYLSLNSVSFLQFQWKFENRSAYIISNQATLSYEMKTNSSCLGLSISGICWCDKFWYWGDGGCQRQSKDHAEIISWQSRSSVEFR